MIINELISHAIFVVYMNIANEISFPIFSRNSLKVEKESHLHSWFKIGVRNEMIY